MELSQLIRKALKGQRGLEKFIQRLYIKEQIIYNNFAYTIHLISCVSQAV